MATTRLHDASASDAKGDLVEGDLADRVGESARKLELEDVDAGLGTLDRAVNRIVEVLGIGVLTAIVMIIFINAVARYAWDLSLPWTQEVVLLLMPWLAMLGTFLAVRRGTLIRIDFFYSYLPAAVRRPVAFAGYILSVIMLVFLGVLSTRLTMLFGSYPSVILGVPTGWSTLALAIGGFAVAAAFLAILLRELAVVWRSNGDES